MDFFVWETRGFTGYCSLDALQGFDGLIDMKRGRLGSLISTFPADVLLPMSSRFPKAIKLPDQIINDDSLIVISPAMADVVRGLNIPYTELLPVTIMNHKGKVASTDYRIVNPCKVQDCIDQTASDLMWNRIDPNLIAGCRKLVLDPKGLDPEVSVFRPAHLAHFIIVREDVASKIAAHNFKGVLMTPLGKFDY